MRFPIHLSVAALFFSLLVFFPIYSVAQKKTTEVQRPESSVAQRNQKLINSIQRLTESTLQTERRFADSLVAAIASIAKNAATRIETLADSLIRSAHDSLDSPRRDSLRFVARSLQRQLLALDGAAKKDVSGPVSRFAGDLTKGKKTYSVCDSCESGQDFDDRLEQFREYVENLRELLRDTISTLMDDRKDIIQDRYESVRDSLGTLRDVLTENRLAAIDYERYEATRLTISTRYSSHVTYRGRDNGVPQQMIAPSVAFYHSSGLSAEVSTYWLDQTPKRWDDLAVSVGYEFTAGSIIGGALSYSHFWFSDSSRSSNSVFTNSFGASLSLNWPVLSLSVNGDLATGTASEFTLAVSASREFDIPLTLRNKISIGPRLTATLGEQNSTLTTLRTKGGKGKKGVGVTNQTSSVFGILDYEISLPVTIILGQVSLSPSVNYIVPLNVIDESTTGPLIDFEFGISVTFR